MELLAQCLTCGDSELEAGRLERDNQGHRLLRFDGDGHVDIGGQARPTPQDGHAPPLLTPVGELGGLGSEVEPDDAVHLALGVR